MEMSGLDPQFCRILEVAVVVTASSLITVSEGIVLAIHQNEDHLETMDDWNQTTHKRTGLIDRVKSSTINIYNPNSNSTNTGGNNYNGFKTSNIHNNINFGGMGNNNNANNSNNTGSAGFVGLGDKTG